MKEDKQDWRLPEGFQWADDAGPSPEERMQEAIAEMESAIAELRKPVTTAPSIKWSKRQSISGKLSRYF